MKWVCTSCSQSHEREKFITSAVQVESELDRKIQEYQWKVHNEPAHPDLLREIVLFATSELWKETLHPLHWLNVSAYKLIGTTAALYANMQMMEESYPPPLSKFSPLLRLFALALLRQIAWLEQSVVIARKGLTFQDLISCKKKLGNRANENAMELHVTELSPVGADTSQVLAVLNELCKDSESLSSATEEKKEDASLREGVGSEVANSVFHAGQNLILAGDPELALRLYSHTTNVFCALLLSAQKTRLSYEYLSAQTGAKTLFPALSGLELV
jgi:hypothetical protein